MTDLASRFKVLRGNLRRHGAVIAEDVWKRYHPMNSRPKEEICVFCNSPSAITKEHVLPKWLFESDTDSTFISSINRQTQTYNKAVVPACAVCNSSILAFIENQVIRTIQLLATSDDCGKEDLCNIIRWLEITEYKLQVLDCRRKYIKQGDLPYDHTWGVFPVAMMRHLIDAAPWKTFQWLRRAQRRIMVKAKDNCANSLVVINTKVPHFYFFSLPDEYIYISFPMYNIAVFYFLKRRYESYKDAAKEAVVLIKKVTEL